jgi:hypothetical protein
MLMSKPSVHCGGTELFDIKKILHSNKVVIYMIERMKAISEGSRVKMGRHLPAAYPAKAAPPFSSSKNRLHSCRLSIAESVGQTTDGNRARLHSLFGMKFTQVPSQYSKGIGEVKATIEVWVCAKAPSGHVSHESSTALWLFKQ